MVDIFLSTIKRLVGYVAVGVAMMVPLLPLYIGKGETIGRGEGNLSANFCNLHKPLAGTIIIGGTQVSNEAGLRNTCSCDASAAKKITLLPEPWTKILRHTGTGSGYATCTEY